MNSYQLSLFSAFSTTWKKLIIESNPQPDCVITSATWRLIGSKEFAKLWHVISTLMKIHYLMYVIQTKPPIISLNYLVLHKTALDIIINLNVVYKGDFIRTSLSFSVVWASEECFSFDVGWWYKFSTWKSITFVIHTGFAAMRSLLMTISTLLVLAASTASSSRCRVSLINENQFKWSH